MQTDTTRRQILALGTSAAAYAAGAAIVAGGVALVNEARADTLDTAAWDAAMAHFNRCATAAEIADAAVGRADDRFRQIQPDMEKLDLRGFPGSPGWSRGEVAHQVNLDELEAKWRTGEGVWWRGEKFDREATAAFKRVRDFRAAFKAAEDASGIVACEDAADRAGEALSNAETTLMGMPAPHIQGLRWKLDRVFDDCQRGHSLQPYVAAYVRQTIADYQRLLGGEAQA